MEALLILKHIKRTTARLTTVSGLLLIGWLLVAPSAPAAEEQDKPLTNADVIKMLENKIPESVIVAKIQTSTVKFDTSADAIIELNKQGVSEKILAAMLNTKGSLPAEPTSGEPKPPTTPNAAPAGPPPASFGPAPAPPAPTPAPVGPVPPGPPPPPTMVAASPPAPPAAQPQVSLDYFHAQLAPYGIWVEVPGYGQCWRPTKVIAATPGGDWRPYYDNGHWEYTENGWFWVSDYNWGDIPFHYGRWIREPGYGWLWVPDLTWGPAWVCWRHAEADGYIGWAPLPFGAVWVEGGWRFHGRAVVDVGFDFGLGEDFFVFVGHDHFHERYFRVPSRRDYAFHVHREAIHGFYGRTVLRNEFRRDEHGRFVNEGLGRRRVEEVTHHKVEVARFEERHPAVRPEKPQPPARGGTPATAARGGTPPTAAPATPTHGPAQAPPTEPNKVFRPPTTPAKATTPPRPTTPARPTTTPKK